MVVFFVVMFIRYLGDVFSDCSWVFGFLVTLLDGF